ncbi:glucosamine inositolphosphorylceramide transferase family protein [Geomesophilobacter sediminis]|uniref:Glucosamine inositolphosphorylceramide transferase 1 N-terminal domain-containing protein n=1 Tax=Geomesophilobacter sediminis TaxID=2798584 RepID=A0A8J7IPG2_9BACT|nr:hypothetical protein [Geomesophilobacter sediminis]MBJ6724249.1 hypothetical protein [Geomesophilobacter sediminis]
MSKRKLRIGLLMNGPVVHAWIYRVLERLAASGGAEIALVIYKESPPPRGLRELWVRRRRGVYFLFDLLDRRLFRRPDSAFARVDASELLAGVPVLTVRPRQQGYLEEIEEAELEKIRGGDLDILIRFGFQVLAGGILGAARYGVWSHHHGDNRSYRGGPPGFWEVVRGTPVTGSILQLLNEELDGGQILCRSWSLTDWLSPTRNREHLFWSSSSFLPRQIERLHRMGAEAFFASVAGKNPPFSFYDRPMYRVPANLEALGLVVRHGVRVAARSLRKCLYRDQWWLMFALSEQIPTSLRRYRAIAPPKDRFWADPHLVYRQGKYYIFVEELVYRNRRAHISVLEMDEAGNYTAAVPVLERPYHLSYPFVFEWEGTWYMVPESSGNGTVELYECVEFPHRWRFRMNLMQGVRAVDATLHYADGRWWLFAALAEHPRSSIHTELCLFSSPELFTDRWTPHPENPIVSDARNARPAGRIFAQDGRLYRPAQNCSGRYGRGFNLNEITLLTQTEYREERVVSVEPNWRPGMTATHTLSREHRLCVIDALMSRRKFF